MHLPPGFNIYGSTWDECLQPFWLHFAMFAFGLGYKSRKKSCFFISKKLTSLLFRLANMLFCKNRLITFSTLVYIQISLRPRYLIQEQKKKAERKLSQRMRRMIKILVEQKKALFQLVTYVIETILIVVRTPLCIPIQRLLCYVGKTQRGDIMFALLLKVPRGRAKWRDSKTMQGCINKLNFKMKSTRDGINTRKKHCSNNWSNRKMLILHTRNLSPFCVYV